MIQTIVLLENSTYPFGQFFSTKKLVKVEDIRSYSSLQQLKEQKTKVQNFHHSNDKSSQTTISFYQNVNFIKLMKIYQEDLFLHYIYEYIPHSLNLYIQNKLYGQIDLEKSHILEMNSKLFLKKVCYQLSSIINYLIKKHIKTNLEYELLGIDEEQNLKFFLDSNFQILYAQKRQKQTPSSTVSQIQNQLRIFYEFKKEQILFKLQTQFRKLKKKQQYIPNFVVKGNQLIFCKPPSELSSQCPSNFTQSSFTDRCQSIDSNYFVSENQNIRKTHGNLFNKLKKAQSFNCNNYNTQSNRKLQQNMKKLQNLRLKSKKLNQQLKQSFLSNKQNFSSTKLQKKKQDLIDKDFNAGQHSHIFRKKQELDKDEQAWRNSQIPSNLRKTHLPNGAKVKSPHKFDTEFFGKRSKSTRNHKSSFQFKPKSGGERDWFNPNRSFEKECQQDFDKSFQQTKSIRIELQQSKKNKERKNSYKVKILTCQQMQVDGENIEQFVFNTMNKNFENNENQSESQNIEDVSNNQQDVSQRSQQSKHSKYSNRYQNMFSQKFRSGQRDEEVNSKFSQSPVKHHVREKQRDKNRDGSSQKNIFEKYNEQFGQQNEKGSKNPKLQEKIKLAKQKAEDVLNKYMKNKKFSNKNSSSKLYP